MKIDARHDPKATQIPVAPALIAMSPVYVSVVDCNGYDVELRLDAQPSQDDRAGRYVCTDLHVRQRPGGSPVTTEALRSIPVAALMKEAHKQYAHEYVLSDDSTFEPGATTMTWRDVTPEVEKLKEQGPTRETLSWVAYLYQLALVKGERPTKAVETALELPTSTAGRWVAIARERGLLGIAEGPGKAGG